MSFVQALSGLYGASSGLDVISNNVANASTVGYKNSRAEFSDVFASYLKTDAGHGTYAPTVAQQFTQGALASTDNQLDFSINGNGMFQLSNNIAGDDRIAYTRNGEFHFAPVPAAAGTTTPAATIPGEKYIVNANGNYLMGWADGVDPTSAPSVLKITDSMAGFATTTSNFRFNLDDRATVPTNPVFSPTDPNSFNWSSSQEIFSGVTDDVTPHSLKLYFAKTAVPNTWNVYSSIDDVVSPTAQAVTFTPGGLLSTGGTFSSTGSVTANVETADPLTGTITSTTTVVPMTIAIDLGTSTQFGAGFDQAKSEQDGYKDGRLAGTSLALDGTIVGNYSNGKSQNIARVALATFINPNGLKSIGDNLWLESTQSGAANVGAAGANGRGILASNSLEQSNVDLAGELVNMITMQRNYQANAQAVKTQDEVLKTLSGLR